MLNNEHKVYSVYPWSIFMVRSHGKMPPKELRYKNYYKDILYKYNKYTN